MQDFCINCPLKIEKVRTPLQKQSLSETITSQRFSIRIFNRELWKVLGALMY